MGRENLLNHQKLNHV